MEHPGGAISQARRINPQVLGSNLGQSNFVLSVFSVFK
jgi:hypothetical protein